MRTRRPPRSPRRSRASAFASSRPSPDAPNSSREEGGVLLLDHARIDRVNAVDEAITFATLSGFRAVSAGEMVATVKIIPYAVPRSALEAAMAQGGTRSSASRPCAPACRRDLHLAAGLKPSVVAKTLERAGPAPRPSRGDGRLRGARGASTARSAEALRRAIAASPDLVIVFGASAISDRRDVIPAAVEAAGGSIEHLGMPVDPAIFSCSPRWAARPSSARRAARAQPEGERLRLGAATPACGPAVGPGRGRGHGRRRPSDGDQDPTAAPRRAAEDMSVAAMHPGRRALDPDGDEQAPRRCRGEPLIRRTAEAVLARAPARSFSSPGTKAEKLADAIVGLDLIAVETNVMSRALHLHHRRDCRAAEGDACAR